MRQGLARGLLAAALLAPLPAGAAEAAPVVKLAQGRLAGSSAAGIERFLNIPFAAAPVGALR